MNVLDQIISDNYALYLGDCCEVVKGLPDSSIHFTITSIPFSNLYIYSDSIADMGNCADDAEFFRHFGYLIPELHRVTIPGRLSAIHCKQLVNYKGRDGMAGLRDFRGDIIRAFTAAGWAYHSEVCIWKDPVIEMQRTKAHGLLYKQLCADSSFSRQGMAEYLLIFRRWPENDEEESRIEPVNRAGERFASHDYIGTGGPPKLDESYGFDPEPIRRRSIAIWQRYASPVWMDIQQTNVLNVQQAREDRDEKHICPLQLDVIERSIELWTNPGDVVFDPFGGIGSTPYVALKMGRKAIASELKRRYWEIAQKNCQKAELESQQPTLFDSLEVAS